MSIQTYEKYVVQKVALTMLEFSTVLTVCDLVQYKGKVFPISF